MEKQVDSLKEFPCPNCSSELNYDAETRGLKCLHCHSKFNIENSNDLIVEQSFDSIKNLPVASNESNTVTYNCSKCGTLNSNTNNIVFFECTKLW